MKTRKMATVWIGMLLLGIVSSANAAEVQKYVWGSGPMGASGGSAWVQQCS